MVVPVRVIGDSQIHLWHLDSTTRLQRQIAAESTLTQDHEPTTAASPLLLVSAAFLYEGATLRQLAARPGTLLVDPASQRVAVVSLAAGHSETDLAQAVALLDEAPTPTKSLRALTPADIAVYDGKLRRHSVPTLARLEPEAAERLEDQLYGAAYKGITDLVTKWLWPRPARVGVRWCAALNLTPNQVTLFGAALMLLALWAFAVGAFAIGLAAGWLMTYLDTVDGKLARVRVQSSPIGHVLDHGMDIIHPPFWYLAWAWGLPANAAIWNSWDLATLATWIFAGYLGGRVIEGLFHSLGECSMFAWRPFDAWFRLITGRRNPCMILLTVGVAIGRPDLGLLWVVWWTLLSTAILGLRLLYAAMVRLRSGPLTSWLADGEAAARRHPGSYRTFARTRAAYGSANNAAASHG